MPDTASTGLAFRSGARLAGVPRLPRGWLLPSDAAPGIGAGAEPVAGRVPDQAIREQLARIVRSEPFAQSERLMRFLHFTVEAALAGRADTLKEYAIGTRVYDRPPGYAPARDSIVRTEARRLRAKLAQYYAAAGRSDPVEISYRPGSYAPHVCHRRPPIDPPGTVCDDHADAAVELLAASGSLGVAVLPFSDLSGTARSGVQARAVADALAYGLARTDGFRVFGWSPTATARPADAGTDGLPLTRARGVQVVFDGTVREEAGVLGITCRLANADGSQIWSQRFESDAEALPAFALAERVAVATISRTRAEPSTARDGAVPRPSLLPLYPTVLKAEATLDDGHVDDLRVAVSRLEELVRVAPHHPRPYWDIAQCHHELAHRGVPSSAAGVARAGEVAAMGVEINPDAAAGHAALATARALAWDWRGAGESYRRAVTVGADPRACRQYGLLLIAQGRTEPGWHFLDLAQEVDPFSQAQKAAVAKGYYFTRRYADAARHFARPGRFGPLSLTAELLVALCHVQVGAADVALAIVSAARTRVGSQATELAALAEVTALGGDVAAARRIVSDHRLAEPEAAMSCYRRALLLLALGDERAALSALARSCESRDAELVWLAIEPRFDRLRHDARFVATLERVGLQPSRGGLVTAGSVACN